VGYPRLFPETQHAYWFYPFDPAMPNLPAAADPVRMASVLLGPQAQTTDVLAASGRLAIERVRHVPEVGAILRYTMSTPAAKLDLYGKVQPDNRGLRTYRIVQKLWEAASRYPGYGWEHNCGYPTIDHRKALRELGVTPFHRQDFGTVKIMLLGEQLELDVATA
jgi:hypothetical protein